MKPLFYKGQIVVCVDSNGTFDCATPWPLIEGKKYTIDDPDYKSDTIKENFCAVSLFNVWGVFDQERFIPLDNDAQLEEEIHESLKGKLIIEKH